jgi:HAD superfamily hydrolase (TIGR01509 family)
LNREEIRSLRRTKYEKLIAEEKIRPGVEEYLKSSKDLGLRVGLASSAPKDWVMEHLTKLNLVHYFDCIRVREDAKKVKPDPDLYLQVINYFGIEPKEAIAFEDSPNGALAAKQAGMYCVIIPNDVTKVMPLLYLGLSDGRAFNGALLQDQVISYLLMQVVLLQKLKSRKLNQNCQI